MLSELTLENPFCRIAYGFIGAFHFDQKDNPRPVWVKASSIISIENAVEHEMLGNISHIYDVNQVGYIVVAKAEKVVQALWEKDTGV